MRFHINFGIYFFILYPKCYHFFSFFVYEILSFTVLLMIVSCAIMPTPHLCTHCFSKDPNTSFLSILSYITPLLVPTQLCKSVFPFLMFFLLNTHVSQNLLCSTYDKGHSVYFFLTNFIPYDIICVHPCCCKLHESVFS